MIISPILRSTRLFTACGIKQQWCCLLVTRMRRNWNSTASWSPVGRPFGALYHKLHTRFSVPEDGRHYRPKHVELIEIVNKIIIDASSRLFMLLLLNQLFSKNIAGSLNTCGSITTPDIFWVWKKNSKLLIARSDDRDVWLNSEFAEDVVLTGKLSTPEWSTSNSVPRFKPQRSHIPDFQN